MPKNRFARAALAAFLLAACAPYELKAEEEGGWGKLPDDFNFEYKLGDVFDIPDLEYTGAEMTNATLIFPDHTAKFGTGIRLTEPGIYTLSYTAKKDGLSYSKNYDITVRNTLYSFSGTASTAEYRTYAEHGEGEGDFKDLSRYPNTGLWVNLAKGETLTFNQAIPLSNFDGSQFLQAFVTPKNRGTADFNSLDVFLTDAEDPAIYVRFNVLRHTDTNRYTTITSVKVAGQNQPLTGFEASRNIYHVNNNWGTNIAHSFTDVEFFVDPTTGQQTVRRLIPSSKFQFILGYNDATKTCYTGRNNGKGIGEHTLEYVADLDSLVCYEDLWSGFTSDKVYLSFRANTYNSSSADFMITYLRDFPDLSLESVDDTEGPNLEIEGDFDPNAMPEAYLHKPYTIPSAHAKDDVSGEREVEMSVDFNYISGNPESVSIEDGTFTPTQEGIYRIRYVAKDSFRNETEKVLYVHAGGAIDPLTVSLSGQEVNAPVGAFYELPKPTVSGGSGSTSLRAYLGEIDITDAGGFTPEQTGDQAVRFVVSDFAGASAETTLTVHVVPNDTPIISETPTLPRYFFSGASYALPLLMAKDYSSGSKVETPCQVEIKNGAKTTTLKAGDAYSPVVSENLSKVSLRYYSGKTSLDAVEVPVILAAEDGKLRFQNYFVGAGDSISLERTGASFVAKEGQSSLQWTFANPLPAEGASFTVANIPTKSNVGSLKATFTDESDPALSVTITFLFDNDSIQVKVGSLKLPLSGSFNGDASFAFDVGLVGTYFHYAPRGSSTSRLLIKKDDNGNPFRGFTSDLVYLSVEADDVAADNGYMVSEVNGHPISSFSLKDVISPNVYLESSIGGKYSLGSEYTIGTAKAYDTIAPNASIQLTVKDPSGAIVTDVNGVLLDGISPDEPHTILLSSYGTYSVSLVASETGWPWSNATESAFLVEAIDTTAPSLTLSHNLPKTVKVGDVIYLPPFEAHDDLTSDENLRTFACVILPSGREIALEPDQGVKATLPGDYDFMIFAMDEFGNSTSITRTVTAVE